MQKGLRTEGLKILAEVRKEVSGENNWKEHIQLNRRVDPYLRRLKIKKMIEKYPDYTFVQIAKMLGISRSTITYDIKKLRENGEL